jgi:hypothetical protein
VGPPGDEERGGSNGFVISNVIFVRFSGGQLRVWPPVSRPRSAGYGLDHLIAGEAR